MLSYIIYSENNSKAPFSNSNKVLFKIFKLKSFHQNSFEEIVNGIDNQDRYQIVDLLSVENSEKFGVLLIYGKRFYVRYYNYSLNYDHDLGVASGIYNMLENGDEIFLSLFG